MLGNRKRMFRKRFNYANRWNAQEYYKNSEKYILNIRYIDELNLYLCVEAKEGYFTKELEETFYIKKQFVLSFIENANENQKQFWEDFKNK